MKKTITLVMVLAFTSLSFAQKNNIKLNLTNLPLRHLTFAYERALAKNYSLGVQLGLQVTSKAATDAFFKRVTDEFFTVDSRIQGYSGIIEYRFYPGKKYAPRGFYLSPYLKYSQYEAGISTKVADYDTKIKAKSRNIGPGLMIGYQWSIKKRVSLDVFFLGGTASNVNLNVDYTSNDPNVDYEAIARDVQKDIDDIGLLQNNTTVTAKSNGVNVDGKFWLPQLRFGIALGILLGKPHDQVQNKVK